MLVINLAAMTSINSVIALSAMFVLSLSIITTAKPTSEAPPEIDISWNRIGTPLCGASKVTQWKFNGEDVTNQKTVRPIISGENTFDLISNVTDGGYFVKFTYNGVNNEKPTDSEVVYTAWAGKHEMSCIGDNGIADPGWMVKSNHYLPKGEICYKTKDAHGRGTYVLKDLPIRLEGFGIARNREVPRVQAVRLERLYNVTVSAVLQSTEYRLQYLVFK